MPGYPTTTVAPPTTTTSSTSTSTTLAPTTTTTRPDVTINPQGGPPGDTTTTTTTTVESSTPPGTPTVPATPTTLQPGAPPAITAPRPTLPATGGGPLLTITVLAAIAIGMGKAALRAEERSRRRHPSSPELCPTCGQSVLYLARHIAAEHYLGR